MSLPGHSTSEITNYFAWAVQEKKDVEGTTFYFTKHLNGTGFETESKTSNERIGGSGKELGLVYKTQVTADGSMMTYAWPDGLGRVLTTSLGTDVPSQISAATTGASQGLHYHFISSGSATLPYLTFKQQWAEEVEQVTNGVWSEVKIEGEHEHPLKISGSFITGGTPQVLVGAGASATITRESGEPFMVPGGSAFWSWSASTGGGVGTSNQITKWSLGIKNGLDDAIRTLSLFREDIVWNTVDFNLDGTIKYVNTEAWNAIHYGGGTQVPITVPTGAFGFYSGQQSQGGSISAFINCPYTVIGNAKVNKLDPDGKTMYMDFTAFTIANATKSVWAGLITGATKAYTEPST
jgi:hypothetical protein